jgi:hypothetical protein
MNNLKPLVNDKSLWESFLAELNSRLNEVHRQMEQAQSADDLYRLQGQASCLNSFKYLREKVNGSS